MKEMENLERCNEISDMLFDMAQKLMEEGEERRSYNIETAGNMLLLVSGLIKDAKDMETVSDLMAMYSAKKILDGQMMAQHGMGDIEDIIRKMRDEFGDDNEFED